MSLRYLTILESIRNLSSEEINSLMNELFTKILPPEKLRSLRYDIKAARNHNITIARKNLSDEVRRIGCESSDTDVIVGREVISVCFKYKHNEYNYKIIIKNLKMELIRYIKCICPSPYFCNDCGSKTELLSEGKIINGAFAYTIIDVQFIDWEWIHFAMLYYMPLLLNFPQLQNRAKIILEIL